MKIKDINVGKLYDTTLGVAEAIRVGGTYPPSVEVIVKWPIPRGRLLMKPRDFKRELTEGEVNVLKNPPKPVEE